MEQDQIKEDNEIDEKIIEENNSAIKSLSEDLINISEIFQDLSCMLNLQGENIDLVKDKIEKIENDVSVGVESLEKTENYVIKFNQIMRNAGIIIGGLSLGSLGFLGGPIIGAVTLVSGVAASSGIVFVTRKIN
jgi:hypothetical protein